MLYAYCSLFPKDYAFKKKDLVLLWMAEGFLHQSSNDASLFVMHDLMNDLATFIAGDFFFKLEKNMEKDDRIKDLEKLRHMSFVCEEFKAYKKFEVFQRAKGLRTFFSVEVKERWERYFLSNKVLVDLLPQLPVIRVISLSGYEISEVPESFGSLKHLRFSKLKNLRHLDIRGTPRLKDMTLGIGELKSLQTLSKIIFEGENDFSINQLKDLNNLQGEISFKGLDKVLNTMEAREASLSQKRITVLKVEWDDGSREQIAEKEVLDALQPYDDCLKKLVIVNYLGLEFPKWVGDPLFRQLARVSIRGCRKCASLPPLGQLQPLKELSIEDMGDIKVVGSEFFGPGLAFPSLESLSFLNMSGWEVWSTNSRSGVRDSVFPCLQELNIKGCPNLVEFSLKAPLLSLRDLRVDECGDGVLRSLVHAALSVTKMEINSISGLTNEV
nr:NBS-LRR resistance-like protein [Tanacetum cinerariifolium]